MGTFMCWQSARRQCPPMVAAWALALGGALFTSQAMAIDLSDTVHLHGFASQAYVSTSDNRYFGPSDSNGGSFEFTELGANLSWQALSNLQFAGQVGYRKAGDTEQAEGRLDYGLADLAFYNGADSRVGIRAGRYRMPIGLYNLTRDVANSRPSIFLPAVYSDSSRSLLLALDGAQVYWESRTAVGDFFFNVGEGKFPLDKEQQQVLKDEPSYVTQLLYELDGGRVRLGLTGIDAKVKLIPYGNAEASAKSYIVSAQYNAENWSLTGEIAPDAKTSITGVPPPWDILLNGSQKPMQSYLQGTYRFAPRWEALLRYDVAYADKGDKSGEGFTKTPLAMISGQPAFSRFAKDWTAGVSWEVRHDTKIRAEWHHVQGTLWLSAIENPNPLSTKENWDLFALQASYNF